MQLSRVDEIRLERQRIRSALWYTKHPKARDKGNARIAELDAELHRLLNEREYVVTNDDGA